jgi:hypothetical protein
LGISPDCGRRYRYSGGDGIRLSSLFRTGQPLTHNTQVHGDKMRAALTMDMLATDLADYLVRKGVSSAGHCWSLEYSNPHASTIVDPVPRNASYIREGDRTCGVEEVSVERFEPGGLQGVER